MKLFPRYLRATNTPEDTREKFSLEEPGLTYERTSSQSELARCGINYQKRWLWQKTSTHSSDYWTSTGKNTPADTIIRPIWSISLIDLRRSGHRGSPRSLRPLINWTELNTYWNVSTQQVLMFLTEKYLKIVIWSFLWWRHFYCFV